MGQHAVWPPGKDADMSTMYKVLVVASNFSHIRNFHLPYLKGFGERGWEIHLACGGELEDIPFTDRVISVPFQKSLTALANWKASAMLRREIKANGYDLVITHTSLAAFFTRIALKGLRMRPRCINVVHGYLFDEASGWARRTVYTLAEKLVANVTDEILTMNQYDCGWARKTFPGTRVGFIHGMGVDEARIRQAQPHDFGFPEGSVVLIFPAEFSERKNQAMLIRAMARLPDHVCLVLPGNGALLEQCKTLANELGVMDRVLFPGRVADVLPMLKAADIAVSSSRYEGLPFNLMEAMFCGLPIVASRVKGNCDLVEDGGNGYLYDYDDDAAFVNAVRKLIDSSELRAAMGRISAERAQAYSLKTVYPQVMGAYLDHLAKQDVGAGNEVQPMGLP